MQIVTTGGSSLLYIIQKKNEAFQDTFYHNFAFTCSDHVQIRLAIILNENILPLLFSLIHIIATYIASMFGPHQPYVRISITRATWKN